MTRKPAGPQTIYDLTPVRHGRTEPRTQEGRAHRADLMRALVKALGTDELRASVLAARLDWSDYTTQAVLESAFKAGYVTRRRETEAERLARVNARRYPRQWCLLYKATGALPVEQRRTVRQPPRMIFRPLPEG